MTVVVGYVPNEFGDSALEAGVEEARRRGSRVVAVNATRGDAYIDERFVGESLLGELEERLASLDVECVFRQTIGADIADELIAVAEEVDADMIVLGLRSRTPVGKLLMGSVAQRVLLDAPCAVLTVKPPGFRAR
ncbi:universal stress protein [Nocardioides jishulii]|uniref:Universal stress protein n=1 Tax=Nocardioides jishulii TaxID=2575440 RepID=A0A4U2YJN0_9ACTN|nr:universal stress protein [Nocardioides jishulii]QCX26894.1 universal stress protein [Nocardioides jishulii]TKI61377.1 universal stress protein [Nocardioides jishulii]